MATCPNCGAQQPDGATFCDECGAKLGEMTPSSYAPAPPAQSALAGTTTCPSCGAAVMLGEAFCDNCGAALDSPTLRYGERMGEPSEPSEPPASAVQEAVGALLCSRCGAQLEPGSNFCDMCGAPVEEAPGPAVSEGPARAPETRPSMPAVDEEPAAREEGYPAGPSVQGRLVVQGTNATLSFPPGRTEIVVGREDPISDIFPDIDLTDHGADQAGVSRRHARITIEGSEIQIEDLRSTNYTFVNQQRLTPGQPHPLKDGDEVRLGRLKLTFRW